jgi:hypothetical protein
LVSLNLDGRKVEQADRPNDAVCRQGREAEAQQLESGYRLLSDGIPATLSTVLNLQVAGDAREETLSGIAEF